MKPRRRTILKVIALLLAWGAAGAALNVVVAWGLAVDPPEKITLPVSSRPFTSVRGGNWMVICSQQRGITRFTAGGTVRSLAFLPRDTEVEGLYPSWSNWASELDLADGWTEGDIMFEACGWPAHSLQSEWHDDGTPTGKSGWVGALALPPRTAAEPKSPRSLRALPLCPLWPGFAINTVFYAGVIWVLFCGPFALRRMIRRRRGQCAQCAYPIGQNQRCTECGATVVPKAINA